MSRLNSPLSFRVTNTGKCKISRLIQQWFRTDVFSDCNTNSILQRIPQYLATLLTEALMWHPQWKLYIHYLQPWSLSTIMLLWHSFLLLLLLLHWEQRWGWYWEKVKVKPAVKLSTMLVNWVISDSGSRSLPGRSASVVINKEDSTVAVHPSLPAYSQQYSTNNVCT